MPALLLLLLTITLIPTQVGATAPRKVDLGGEATLIVPEGYTPREGRVDLVVHFHGAEATIERALAESGWSSAVVVVNRRGLSSAYAIPFDDPKLFARILERAREAFRADAGAEPPEIGRLVVSSFSAGFGAVRAILAVPDHFDRIDALVLADTLYCGYHEPKSKRSKRRPDPALMDGFRRFAAEATAGRKAMLVTHSAQVPEGYASTTETADDLIRHADLRSEPADDDWGDGWRLTRRAAKGKLLILGFGGKGAQDHLRHLRRLGAIWKALP